MEVETHSPATSFNVDSATRANYSAFIDQPPPMLRASGFRTPDEASCRENFEDGATECNRVKKFSDHEISPLSVLLSEAVPYALNGVDHTDLVSPGPAAVDAPPTRRQSSAAMKVQKVYRSYRTRRMLADSAVVAEELWWQALDYARLNHSTVSFFNFLKPETTASRWNRVKLIASKVGKGLSKDAKAQKLAFQHWIEAIDPRHRYGHNLHLYYEEWCNSESGQPFFFWLDLGDGKKVDLKECSRAKLQRQCIKYLGPQERENYEYVVVEGKVLHRQTRELLSTTKLSPGGKWIFVMSTSKKLYAGEKKKGLFHHSSFLAGGATLAAGRLVVENGTPKSISPYSGHYRPTDDNLNIFVSFLKENGVNLDEVEIKKANEDYENYEEGKSGNSTSTSELSSLSESPPADAPNEEENKDLSSESTGALQPAGPSGSRYKRTLSGGLQSPRAEVPKTSILQRINSKKASRSYQLGQQLSRTWTTGAGPRIGCIADYPIELRLQALELTNLSPRRPRFPGLISPPIRSSSVPVASLLC